MNSKKECKNLRDCDEFATKSNVSLQDLEYIEQLYNHLNTMNTKMSATYENCIENVIRKAFQDPDSLTETERVTIKPSIEFAKSEDHFFNFPLYQNGIVYPDVQKVRALEDIHTQLIQQIEATDSLEGFLKLMSRHENDKKLKTKTPSGGGGRKEKRTINEKKEKQKQLEEKYAGSLWFFNKKRKNYNSTETLALKINKLSYNPQECDTVTPKKSRTKKPRDNTRHLQDFQFNTSTLLTNEMNEQNGCYYNGLKIGNSQNKNESIKYCDPLDDLDTHDLKPIKSEYPRRDKGCVPTTTPSCACNAEKKESSYLERIISEEECQGNILEKLVKPSNTITQATPKKFYTQIKAIAKKKNIEKKENTPSSNEKENVHQPQQGNLHNLIEYLIKPDQLMLNSDVCHNTHTYQQNLIVMPVQVVCEYGGKEIEPPSIEKTHIKSIKIKGESNSVRVPEFGVLERKKNPKAKKKGNYNQRERLLLHHLHHLKARNDSIQGNIKKAIDVIETKMVGILNGADKKSGNTENDVRNDDKLKSDAFEAMENELKNVITLMNVQHMDHKKPIPIKPQWNSDTIFEAPEKDENSQRKPKFDINFGKVAEKHSIFTKTHNKNSNLEIDGVKKTKLLDSIDASENILGQVDNVINTIEGMYSKFMKPTKMLPNVLDGLKEKGEEKNEYDEIHPVFRLAFVYGQSLLFYTLEIIDEKFEEIVCIDLEQERFSMMVEKFELTKQIIWNIIEESLSNYQLRDFVDNLEFRVRKFIDCSYKSIRSIEVSSNTNQKRHQTTLNIFYAVYFYIMFLMLNLNYSS